MSCFCSFVPHPSLSVLHTLKYAHILRCMSVAVWWCMVDGAPLCWYKGVLLMQADDCDKGAAGLERHVRLEVELGRRLEPLSRFIFNEVSCLCHPLISPLFLPFFLLALQQTDLGQEFYTVARGKKQTTFIKSVGPVYLPVNFKQRCWKQLQGLQASFAQSLRLRCKMEEEIDETNPIFSSTFFFKMWI